MSLARSADITTRYEHILGFAYQVLGDAALAVQATKTVCLRCPRGSDDELVVWRCTVEVIRDYLLRGFVVRPLMPEGQYASLLSALQQLEPEARMIVLLRYHEALSIPKLGAVMATDHRTIRRVLAEARGTLLDQIGARDAL